MQFENSDALCEYVRTQSDTVVLSFSRGKDSIAAWLQLKRHGFKVVPAHMHSVPNISFVNESLDYYSRVFQTKIYDLPHPSLYRMLNNFVFQSPGRLAIIESLGLVDYDYDQLFSLVKFAANVPQDTYTGVGVTIFDSLTRRSSISQYGAINVNRKQFFPIFDWSRKRIVAEIEKSGIQLPKEYRMFGRSWDGLDYRFVSEIKEHYPDDYAKIIEMFPMVELEILRYKWRAQHLKGVN